MFLPFEGLAVGECIEIRVEKRSDVEIILVNLSLGL